MSDPEQFQNALTERARLRDQALAGVNLVLPKHRELAKEEEAILEGVKAAIVALHDYDLGFTHKDLQDLDSVIHADNQGWQGQLDSLRERIAALLPPEKP